MKEGKGGREGGRKKGGRGEATSMEAALSDVCAKLLLRQHSFW